jgi:hypothetical protein
MRDILDRTGRTELLNASTPAVGRPSWPRWLFRVCMTVAATLLANQAVYAGQFLAGTYGSLLTHRENATYSGIAVAVAAAAAVLLRWPGRGPLWPVLATVGLFGLIAAQIAIGFARIITVHIPLGVAVIVVAVLLTVWAWRDPRPPDGNAARLRRVRSSGATSGSS